MIAIHEDANNAAKDEAFTKPIAARFVRVVRLVPVCHGVAMVRIGEGDGRVRYYRCKKCKATASGTTIRENVY